MRWIKLPPRLLLRLVTGCWFLVTGHALRVTRHCSLPLLLLLLPGCEVEVPTEVYDNPLDVEEAKEEGLEMPALVFFPDSISVKTGESVSVQVFAMEVGDLGGARVQLTYDKNKLSLSSVTVGDFFQGGSDPIFLCEGDCKSGDASGTIDFFTSYLGTDSVSVTGTGNLAYLIFNTTAPGQSSLQYTSECELVDPDDNPIEIMGFGEGVINAE